MLRIPKELNYIKNSIIIFICFYAINLIISYILFVYVDISNIFPNSYDYLEFFQLIIIFIILYYFNQKNQKIGVKLKTLDTNLYPILVLVLLSSIFFRLSTDPIIWIDETLHFIKIPDNSNPSNNNILIFFSTVILAPLIEEIMFRGIIIKALDNIQIKYKLLISSVFFSLIHLPTDINSLIILFLLGIILGIIALKLGLIFSIIFHSIYNLIWYFLDIYYENYIQLINVLKFNYIYWIGILISLFFLLLILKKIWISKNNYQPHVGI